MPQLSFSSFRHPIDRVHGIFEAEAVRRARGFQSSKVHIENRASGRSPVRLGVNYQHGDTYLFSRTSDVSELGIFLVSDHPLPVATHLLLEFRMGDEDEVLELEGEVVWIDEEGRDHELGMGIRFIDPSAGMRLRLATLVRTIAYLE